MTYPRKPKAGHVQPPLGDYEVGFKKPPKATQFVKGRSGNPKGRPKGSVSLITAFEKALREKVTVNINGRRKTINKLEAAVTQVVNKAAGGDLKAFAQLSIWSSLIGIEQGVPQLVDEALDRKVIEDLQRRMQEVSASSPDTAATQKTVTSDVAINERKET